MARRHFATLFGASLVLAVGACESRAPSGQMIDIGSHRLQIRQAGSGAPAVVIDAGLADQMEKLTPLQERLAAVTHVITYNRAGYGKSEPGPLPRDGAREAEELRTMLERASVPGPYVLVGHSLGALNVQLFASKHPTAVAGMVLLDPPPLSFLLGLEWRELGSLAERMTAEWQALADAAAASADAQERAKSVFFRMIASEHREMFGRTGGLVSAITSFDDTPLVVIASGKPNPAFGAAAGKFQQDWIEQSRALSRKSTRGTFVLAEEASHDLSADAPDLVARSVLSLVQAWRRR